jgi:peptide/nickel transport system substrate-binding protein
MFVAKRVRMIVALIGILTLMLVACGPTSEPVATEDVAPQVIKETVIVEGTPEVVEKIVTQEVEVVVKETVVVEQDAEPKQLAIGLSHNQVSLDPGVGFEIGGRVIFKSIYETPITWADDNLDTLVPSLAESWEVSDDGMTFTFHLREGVKFHTGNEMTAQDVEWSWERAMNLKGNPSFLFEGVTSIEAPDDYTVVVTKEAPDPAFLAKSTYSAFGVLDSQAVTELGGTNAPDADQTDQAEEWLNQNSAGTGPFVLKSWVMDTEVVVEKFPDYWRGPAYFDRVIYRNFPDTATQKLTLEAGDIDLAIGVAMDQIPSLEANPEVKVVTGQGTYMFFLLCNQDPEWMSGIMANEKVCEAMRYAMDYEGIRALAGGTAITPATIVPYGFLGAWGPERAFKRDLDKAKELLAEAGYPDGFDVVLGYPTKFYRSGIDFDIMAEKIQADLADVGIRAELNPAELQTALARYRAGEEELAFWLWGADYYDVNDYIEFLPEGIVGLRANWSDERADDEIKALRDAAKVEVDPAKRIEIWDEIQTYLQDKGAFVALVQPGQVVAHRQWLKGYIFNEAWRVDPYLLAK